MTRKTQYKIRSEVFKRSFIGISNGPKERERNTFEPENPTDGMENKSVWSGDRSGFKTDGPG